MILPQRCGKPLHPNAPRRVRLTRSASVDRVTERPRILVCGWAGAGNIGDELLTDEIVARLVAAGGHPVVRSLDQHRTAERHPGVETVGRGLRWALAARKVDGVCVGPGGIIQDTSSVWSLPAHLWPALVARWLRRPVAGIGLGAVPLRRRTSRWLLRRTLGGAPVIGRDQATVVALFAAGVSAELSVDLALGRHYEARSGRDVMVAAVGPGPGTGRFVPGRRRSLSVEFAAVEPVAELGRRSGLAVRAAAFRGECDIATAQALDSNPIREAEAVAAVAGASLVVTNRYHAAVVAVAAGVPVVVVGSEPKLGALVEQVADADRAVAVADWSQLSHATPPRGVNDSLPYADLAVVYQGIEALVQAASTRGRRTRRYPKR